MMDTMREANRRVKELSSRDPLLEYLDVVTPMLTPDGRPRKQLDGLHLNDRGYQLWTALVSPYLAGR